MLSILEKVSCCDGRDSRTCTKLDVKRLLIIVILPIGVKNLGVEILMILFFSSILFSMFISVISFILFVSNNIPREVNSIVQISFLSLQKLVLLSPYTPVFIIVVFSMLILSPGIPSKSCRILRASLRLASFAARYIVVSSA